MNTDLPTPNDKKDLEAFPPQQHVMEVEGMEYEFEVDESYLNAPKFTKFYRGVLLQMVLFGA